MKKIWAVCAILPMQAFANASCPIVEGSIISDLITSQQLIEAVTSIPSERDEYQTSAEYSEIVRESLGDAVTSNIFEMDNGDRSFISYNADQKRVEVGVGHFDFYSGLAFSPFSLREFFNITIDDYKRYLGEHLIITLAEKRNRTGQFTGENAFGVSTQVNVYDEVTASVHGGIYEDIPSLSVWSFTPDDFVKSDLSGLMRPVITITMDAEVARVEVPQLRSVVALSGLGAEILVENTFFEATIDRPEQVSSRHYLFPSEVLCGGFIDSNSRVLKVVSRLDSPVPYP